MEVNKAEVVLVDLSTPPTSREIQPSASEAQEVETDIHSEPDMHREIMAEGREGSDHSQVGVTTSYRDYQMFQQEASREEGGEDDIQMDDADQEQEKQRRAEVAKKVADLKAVLAELYSHNQTEPTLPDIKGLCIND